MPITRTIPEHTITLYHYDELNDKAKEKAREWFTTDYPDYDWSDVVIEDAKNVGLKIKGFDMDSASFVRNVDIEFIESGNVTLEAITGNHGKECDTYKAAEKFEDAVDAIPELPPENDPAYHLMERESCTMFDALEADFLDDLHGCYKRMLQETYDDLFKQETIEENIRANEYTFTETGKRED